MTTIPASHFVTVVPGVIAAGGTGLSLNGLILTTNTRVPIGAVPSFASPAAVGSYFGLASAEYAASVQYFAGYDNSNIKPGALLFAQYPWAAPVAAYLRGGNISGLTIAQLQAIPAGALTLSVNGKSVTSASINLSAVASFSAAATAIQTAIANYDGVVTAAIAVGAASVTGSIAGTVLTVSAVASGVLVPGIILSGSGVTASTAVVTQLTGTPGGIGTYTVSISQTATSTTITGAAGGGLMTVTAVASGALAVGQVISGGTTQAGTTITSIVTGTGGVGTYGVSVSQVVTSGTISAGPTTCTYDSTSGAFVIAGGTPGTTGTITFATGTIATALLLTAATGAVLSQGSGLAAPATFLSGVTNVTQNWFSFTTMFEPVTADCVALASWVNSQGNRYAFAMWDTDLSPTASTDTTSAGYLIRQAAYSGTIPLYQPSDLGLGYATLGFFASVDYTQLNGRATLAYRQQSGLTPGVTDLTTAVNLEKNGYNYYGAVATATTGFNFFYPGQITGPFLWCDSYADEVWMNAGFQQAILQMLIANRTVPYNAAGYALIEASCNDVINAALNAGVIRTGITLSSAQIASVNAAAGLPIAQTLQQRGWYLQVLDAAPNVRAARGSPPCTFWYTDGQSVQSINLASLAIQ